MINIQWISMVKSSNYYCFISIGKSCSAKILQWIIHHKECHYHQCRAEVTITSFMRVVYPLKYPSNACLSCLSSGPCCWNARVSKYHRCLTSRQVSKNTRM